DVPLQKLLKVDSNLVYGVANFGKMVKYQNNRWQEVKTPLKSHINFIEKVGADSIFLFSNREGLVLMKDEKFTILLPESDVTLNYMIKTNDGILLGDSKMNLFLYKNGKLTPVMENDISRSTYLDEYGIRYFVIQTVNGKYNKIQIPVNYNPSSITKSGNNSYLFNNANGSLLYAKPTDKTFFNNFAKPFGIRGSEESYPLSAIITDISGDFKPDILIFTRKGKYTVKYYVSSEGEFTDESSRFPPVEGIISQISLSVDLTGDGKNDMVYQTITSAGTKLIILKNTGNNFVLFKEIPLPDNLNNHGARRITPVDIDSDGDLDLALTYYYGEKDKPGYCFFLINSWWGNSWDMDTAYKSQTSGWNTQSIFTDVNNDDLIDWLIINKWRHTQLFMNTGNGFLEEGMKRIKPNNLWEEESAIVIDYDNDADLDLVISSDQSLITVYRNDGNGYFVDVTSTLNFQCDSLKKVIGEPMELSSADFNCDGFTDILFSIKDGSNNTEIIFINDSAKGFVDKTGEFLFRNNQNKLNISADLDNDGDEDIYSINLGPNNYWSNNNDMNRSIRINLIGNSGNYNAIGAKLYLIDENKVKRKIAQIGNSEFGKYTQAPFTKYFYPGNTDSYSLKVIFPSGKEKLINNVTAGSLLNIYENKSTYSFVNDIQRFAFETIINQQVQTYFIVILLSVIIIMLVIRYGVAKFKWNFKIITMLVSVNLSAAWLVVILASQAESVYIRYALPLLVVFGGSLFSIVFFTISRKQLTGPFSTKKLEEELLQFLITFSHGEWALRNINSLQLFFTNYSKANLKSPRYSNQLKNRTDTFLELTQLSIKRIIEILNQLNILQTRAIELENNLNRTIVFLKKTQEPESLRQLEEHAFHKVAENLRVLKTNLSEIRKSIYSDFSSNLDEELNRIISIFEPSLKAKNIEIIFKNELRGEHIVLIQKNDLADIVDNFITNAVKAMNESKTKRITIRVSKVIPKYHIDITDTGAGISNDLWKDIFERGYSTHGSSGEGLFYIKNTVEKYGGRVFVKSSILKQGTTFTVELNEGISQ
ncbi:MAG: GHKL domain-containing protein, partial [Ignavibacteria bacterium]